MLCHGVQMHILDRDRADVFAAGLLLMDEIRKMGGDRFEFVSWDEGKSFALDKLLGTDVYRTGEMSAAELIAASREPVEAFVRNTKKYHLYEEV